MAQFGKETEGFSASRTVKIVTTETVENYTVYVIEVKIGPYYWNIRHRYSEFFDLHEKLVAQYKLDKNLLPPKKLFGNQSEAFVRKRQGELEIYLQTVLHHLASIPASLASFLDFHKYEIHGITQALAEELFHKGDLILQAGETFHITPLQLHAISQRLKLPEPTCDTGDATKDLGHVLDFITRLHYLKIVGSKETIGSSNIVQNELTFDMLPFKCLESLELRHCRCDMMTEVDHIKKTLKRLHVHKSIKVIKDVLLLGIGQGAWHGGEEEALLVPAWAALTAVDFSHNSLSSIDESVKMMPRVQFLDLSHNHLEDIQHLQHLSELTHVDLSHNHVTSLSSLHTKFGNIKTLKLAGNRLESLLGFSKLYSLEKLDVSSNEISQVLEVRHISSLPCLESLVLTGNPVTIVVDYRTKILELFGNRATEVCLDGQRPIQKELDTVAILLAIQKSKETRERARKHASKKPAVEVRIADSSPGPHGNSRGSDRPASPSVLVPRTSLLAPDYFSPSRPECQHPAAQGLLPALYQQQQSQQQASHPKPELFRMQVEAIREQGGAAWLTLLNAMTTQHHQNDTRTPALGPQETSDVPSRSRLDRLLSLDASRVRPGHLGVARQQNSGEGSLLDDMDSDTSSTISTGPVGFMLPETLPGKNDSNFTTFLNSLVQSSQVAAPLQNGEQDHRKREERAVHVMWCPTVCYADPYNEHPTCVYVTTENIHFLEVSSLRGSSGWPALVSVYCMPLLNVQQFVVGYEEVYLRLEEAFVGPQGTFTFLTSSPHKTRVFMETLRAAIRRATPEGETCEDTHVVWNGETELNLKAVLNRVECLPNINNVAVILYMLVQTPDVSREKQMYTTHTLVLTAKYLYVVREDYILWPQPTFGIGPSTRPQFEIIHSYPISGRISGIQMYDTDTFTQTSDTLPQNFMATDSSAGIMPNFVGFGVKLVFEMGHQQGQKELDIRVPTSGMRDRFLATLTQVRRELSERSPSPPKVKTSHKLKTREVCSEDTKSETSSRGSRSSIDHQSMVSTATCSSATSSLTGQVDQDKNLGKLNEPLKTPGIPTREDPALDLVDGDAGATAAAVAVVPGIAMMEAGVELPPEITGNDFQAALPAQSYFTPEVRRTAPSPPSSLPIMYPTMELLDHLTACNENVALLKSLSDGMRNLASMTGEELVNYFHSQVALIGGGTTEELAHVMWSSVIPYTSSCQEITTCVLLSTKAVYFISDDAPKGRKSLMPPWKTHNRHKSDSVIATSRKNLDPHHSSGILYPGMPAMDSNGQRRVRVYFTLSLKELKQVNIGLFDQSFRLAGDEGCKVFACITRDNALTETFVKCLMNVLSGIIPSPSPDVTSSDSEPDLYKTFGRTASRSESLEFVHAGRVRFVYPSEDAVSDVTYLMVENVRGKKPDPQDVKILLYLLLFQIEVQSPDGDVELDYSKGKPRTLILTNSHVCLAVEDQVSYPLPHFAKGLPENPNFEVTDVRNLEFLRRVVMSDFTTHDLTLVFADETEEIVVDLNREHFSPDGATVTEAAAIAEIRWTLIIQNMRDRDRLLKMLCRQWSEFHDGEELSVQVSA